MVQRFHSFTWLPLPCSGLWGFDMRIAQQAKRNLRVPVRPNPETTWSQPSCIALRTHTGRLNTGSLLLDLKTRYSNTTGQNPQKSQGLLLYILLGVLAKSHMKEKAHEWAGSRRAGLVAAQL